MFDFFFFFNLKSSSLHYYSRCTCKRLKHETGRYMTWFELLDLFTILEMIICSKTGFLSLLEDVLVFVKFFHG
ncbi:hypothetical protein BRARA_C01038 [Brassica rapa]|uniref:Uncharacterized protein n=1 Tax=Brassica campestris TaxID=3711 RepID=A0A397ZTI0_BRACM|nr:hypothetical protein BRARA_C01038 [Brassica rapa]